VLSSPTLKVFETSDTVGDPVVTLHQCKHVDRTTKRMQCNAPLHLRAHKRGYLAVACDMGHQWVWCVHCCDCSLGTRGCIMPAHWMERDSYDTGKRNHMQRHLTGDGGGTPATHGVRALQRALDGRPMVKVKVKEVPFTQKKMILNPGLGVGLPPFGLPGIQPAPGLQVGVDTLAQLAALQQASLVSSLSVLPGGAGVNVCLPNPPMLAASNPLNISLPVSGVSTLNAGISGVYTVPKTTMLYLSPAATNVAARTLWTDGSLALFSQGLQILQRCKHVDRKRNRSPCPCRLRTRNHKRGYLAIVCEAGHQWVWCSYCCDCARPQVTKPHPPASLSRPVCVCVCVCVCVTFLD
jgi:hypothetical protein